MISRSRSALSRVRTRAMASASPVTLHASTTGSSERTVSAVGTSLVCTVVVRESEQFVSLKSSVIGLRLPILSITPEFIASIAAQAGALPLTVTVEGTSAPPPRAIAPPGNAASAAIAQAPVIAFLMSGSSVG